MLLAALPPAGALPPAANRGLHGCVRVSFGQQQARTDLDSDLFCKTLGVPDHSQVCAFRLLSSAALKQSESMHPSASGLIRNISTSTLTLDCSCCKIDNCSLYHNNSPLSFLLDINNSLEPICLELLMPCNVLVFVSIALR